MELLIMIIPLLLGIFIGRLTKMKEPTVGTLIIDHQSIPEDEPYLFLQTRVNPKALMTKKTVSFDVSLERFVSPE